MNARFTQSVINISVCVTHPIAKLIYFPSVMIDTKSLVKKENERKKKNVKIFTRGSKEKFFPTIV